MKLGNKILLITISIVFLFLSISSVVLVDSFKKNYTEAILTGSYSLGHSLESIVLELLRLGLPLDSFLGMDRKCQQLLETNPYISYVAIADLKGKALYHSDVKIVGRVFDDAVMKKSIAALKPITQLYHRFDGHAYYDITIPIIDSAKVHLGMIRIGFLIDVVQDKIFAALLQVIINFSLSFIIIAFLINYFISRYVSGPVINISEHAKKIAEGNYEEQLEVRTTGELGVLTTALNQMSSQVKQKTKDLERANAELELKLTEQQAAEQQLANLNQQLENRVEQRTVELQHQQTFLQAVLENISDGIVACDEHGKLSFFNRASREMHGVEQEELSPDQWAPRYQLYRADGATPMATEDVPLFRAFQGETVRHEQMAVMHASGHKSFLLASGQAMFDAHHVKIGAVISLHDITEQKIAETHLIAAKEAAEAANRAKSLFLANMSHELRTPLNAILGFSDILRHGPELTEAQKQNLEIIHKSGDYLLGLINDVLDLSKIDAGHLQLNNAPFDVLAMMLATVDMMRVRAREKGLQLRLDQSPDFPAHIIGDETKLRQIVVNLLSNAVKATKEGGVILHLEVAGQGEHLVVAVEDTGSGIAPDHLNNIFNAFYQVESFGNQQGTGLGLTITQQYVALMGGRLTVASTLGKGSTFRVELPLQLPGPEALPEARQNLGEVLELQPGQLRCRVLVVDDQLENRLLLAHLLEKVGFTVQVAEDGAEAVALFQSWRPRFIWMDQRMPVMDGAKATRRIRVLPGGEQVKIVAVTASVFEQEDSTLLQAGFDAIVHKPYQAEQIYASMASLLGVRFVYASKETAVPMATELSPQALAALPAPLRHAFAEALARLDITRIKTFVVEISAVDAALAASIDLLVKNYNFQPILNALDDLPPADLLQQQTAGQE